MKKYQLYYLLIIIYISVLLIQKKRYYFWYPSFNTKLFGFGIPYPDSKKEIPLIINYISTRTPLDIKIFQDTDYTMNYYFKDVMNSYNDITLEYLNYLSNYIMPIGYSYKYIYNRPRPAQIAPDLINYNNGNLLYSITAITPAYPSGHALQCYFIAKVLSIKYPEKKEELYSLALKISNIRIIAGLHYPSDRDFAYWIVDNIIDIKKVM